MEQIKDGVIVVRGAGTQADYREFRQDNEFWYLTGVTTPNAVLVLVPARKEEYLFVPPVQPAAEMWLGDLVDPEEAGRITGIENCLPLGRGGGGAAGHSELVKLLEGLAKRHRTFYVPLEPAENWMMSRDNLQSAAADMERDPYDGRPTREKQFRARLEEELGVKVQNLSPVLDALRVFKTPEEIAAMRRAAEIAGNAHVEAMRTARPGLYEWELAARMTGGFLRQGAMGPAYMAIVGSGPNSCTLHYCANTRRLQPGDVVLIDYGCEFNHYVIDITRTWPVNERFSDRQREVYRAVYDAQEAAFRECKPGSSLARVDAAARKIIAERGFGSAFLHSTCHWLGMSTHDVGSPDAAVLEPGMVFTVEPGVYLRKEGIGVRIEDVVAITEDGYELLSAGIARRAEEVEALRAEALAAAAGGGAGQGEPGAGAATPGLQGGARPE